MHSVEIDTNTLLVIGDEYIYTIQDSKQKGVGGLLGGGGLLTRSIANRKHGCRFIVGDGIKYAQERGNLYLIDVDGKECKLAIIRQQRRK